MARLDYTRAHSSFSRTNSNLSKSGNRVPRNEFVRIIGIKRKFDPFGIAKLLLLRRGKKPLRVNPEQTQAFRPGSRRVDFA
jgi:hypothetical protein